MYSGMCRLLGVVAMAMGGAVTGLGHEGNEKEMLTIGSTAPAIDIEHWVSDGNGKFGKVSEFAKDKVYVVEFWATWCGPCINSMPHLAETQEKYASRGVQIISVSDEDLDTVETFLKKEVRGSEDKEMTYGQLTSAYCLTTDPDGSVYADYMQAAYQGGIPTAFIVGKGGLIEWIGHPMEMDEPLAKVVDGSWDRESVRSEVLAGQLQGKIMNDVGQAMEADKPDEAIAVIDKAVAEYGDNKELITMLNSIRVQIVAMPALQLFQQGDMEGGMARMEQLKMDSKSEEEKMALVGLQLRVMLQLDEVEKTGPLLDALAKSGSPDPMLLNEATWTIYELAANDKEFPEAVIASATAAAKKAADLEPEDGSILDTYAHLLHRSGKLDEAIEVQTRAAKNPGPAAQEINDFLDQLKKEKAGG